MNEPWPRASEFTILSSDVHARWKNFGNWDRTYFPKLVGLQVEDMRLGYCRMVLPFREELEQPMGIVHGGGRSPLS